MASSRITGTNENISTYGTLGAGRDYDVLGDWEQFTDNDLVTATTSEVLECYADLASYADTVILADATTSSSYFRIIRPATGEGHNGTESTGVHFTGTTSHVLRITEANSSLQDLVLTMADNSASPAYACILAGNNSSAIGCIVASSTNAGAAGGHGFLVSTGTGQCLINCLATDIESGGFIFDTSATVYNCTAASTETGFDVNSGTVVAKNCLSLGSAGNDFEGSFGAGTTNNASEDATAPGTVNYRSQTFTFADAANDDYHLHRNDLGAKFRGTDLSADATFPFDDDIDGDTITYWPIGFHAEETQQSSRRTGDNENVSTFAASGADYNAITDWEAFTDVDLVTGAVTEVLECAAGTYSDGLALANATTDGRYFRIIRAAAGAEHGGDPTAGVIFSGTGTNHFDVAEAYAQIQDVVVISAGNSAGTVSACRTNGGARVTFVGVLAKATNAGAGTATSFNAGSSSSMPVFVNCMAYESDGYGFFLDGSTTKRVLSCTSVNHGVSGIHRQGGTVTAINCISDGNLTSDFAGTMGANSDYNAATDATAPGSNSRDSQTFTYVNDAGNDYHLTYLDEGALGFGTSMVVSPEYHYNDDIDAVAITTWSIGFDSDAAVPASGGGTHLYRRRRR